MLLNSRLSFNFLCMLLRKLQLGLNLDSFSHFLDSMRWLHQLILLYYLRSIPGLFSDLLHQEALLEVSLRVFGRDKSACPLSKLSISGHLARQVCVLQRGSLLSHRDEVRFRWAFVLGHILELDERLLDALLPML